MATTGGSLGGGDEGAAQAKAINMIRIRLFYKKDIARLPIGALMYLVKDFEPTFKNL
jgi:hypothetical protein